ncbi:MAG: FtsX-like permease family protein [Saprospiraceae bacterium]|nr:FtsX-like permease family protein [Saprospiraceae bacterium]
MLLLIAWRNLWRHRARSLAIIFSVVLGIWAGAFLVALYYGMGRDRMRIAIREEVSHVQVHHPGFADDQDAAFHFSVDSLAVAVKEMPDLRAYSCRCVAQAMLANASGSNGVVLYGVDPEAENATRGLREMVVQGGYLTNEKSHQLMVGLKLARKMKLNAGAKVVLTFLDAQQNIVSAAFRITGIFESSNAMLDERNVYVRYDELSTLMGIEGRAHEVALLLTTDAAVPATVEALQQKLPQLLIEDWKAISPETAYIISAVGGSSRIILIIIFLALGFGIVNTMLMAVLERTREIGMLMAVGMGKGRVFAMVLLETLLLTLAGTPIGVGLSLISVSSLSKTGIDLSQVAGNMMKGFGLEAVLYPWLPVQQLGEIIVIVIITALIAAIFPAWKALTLKPAEAIRR